MQTLLLFREGSPGRLTCPIPGHSWASLATSYSLPAWSTGMLSSGGGGSWNAALRTGVHASWARQLACKGGAISRVSLQKECFCVQNKLVPSTTEQQGAREEEKHRMRLHPRPPPSPTDLGHPPPPPAHGAEHSILLSRQPAPGFHNPFHGTRVCCHNNCRMTRCWAALLVGGEKSIFSRAQWPAHF